MSPASNLHGTAVILGEKGVLITGRSGAGKTALALGLIEHWRGRGCFARLVADDQCLARIAGGRLNLEAPPAIQGLVEVYGLSPVPCPAESRAVIDLVVRLVESAMAPRYQEPGEETIAGVPVPSLTLRERATRSAIAAIRACLSG